MHRVASTRRQANRYFERAFYYTPPRAAGWGGRRRGQGRSFIEANVLDILGRWELCSFNILAREKYQKLGTEWAYAATGMMSHADAVTVLEAARAHVPSEMVSVTGILAE